jgi:hypothetical protein
MRCTRCRWPSSIWQRDLRSGLCDKCRQIAKGTPALDPQVAVQKALSAHAFDLLKRGECTTTIAGRMIAIGLGEKTVTSVTCELTNHLRAAELLDSGLSLVETRARLVEEGVDRYTAAVAVQDVLQARQQVVEAQNRGTGSAAPMAVGAVLLIAVIGLAIGRFPTVPFAWLVVTAIASAALAAGAGRGRGEPVRELRVRCECGEELPVTEGLAGASIQCQCGRTLQVPSLSELRRRTPGL